jgi:hypothetical protein
LRHIYQVAQRFKGGVGFAATILVGLALLVLTGATSFKGSASFWLGVTSLGFAIASAVAGIILQWPSHRERVHELPKPEEETRAPRKTAS